MHLRGFRVNLDIKYKDQSSTLVDEILFKTISLRPDSYAEILPDIKLIAEFAANVLSENDILMPCEIGSGKFTARWYQLIFEKFIKDNLTSISYESVIKILNQYYETTD